MKGCDWIMAKKRQPVPKKKCAKCEKEYAITQYYSADTTFYPDGKLHICKQCVSRILDEKGFEGFKSVLRLINKPLLQNVYNGGKATYGEYIRQINSLPQYKDMVYDESDFFRSFTPDIVGEVNNNNNSKLTEEEMLESEAFWGSGFSENEYYWLNVEFTDFLNKYEVESKGMELLIQEICLTQLDIRKRRASGEKVDQQLKTLQDLLGSSNLKPVQETGANAVEQESFGTLIKKFEREKPIPEPDPQWEDVDGIKKYLKVFFFGHMAKALGIENKFQDEYDNELKKYTVEQEDGGSDG